MKCPRCGSENYCKDGVIKGVQRIQSHRQGVGDKLWNCLSMGEEVRKRKNYPGKMNPQRLLNLMKCIHIFA
jgi:hypothetical protein